MSNTTAAPARFATGYMDRALNDLGALIEDAKQDLANVDFDTIVGTGFSGGVVVPALALAMGKTFVLIRKENDDSHHGSGRLIGNLGKRWIFVDDMVATGDTRRRVLRKINGATIEERRATEHGWMEYVDVPVPTTYVGDYLYANTAYRFISADDLPDDYRYADTGY